MKHNNAMATEFNGHLFSFSPMPGSRVTLQILAIIFLGLYTLPAFAQVGFGFGQNKVQYKNFNWAVFRTTHFDVHYYTEAEATARDGAKMAERAYQYLSTVFDHQFHRRIPLILYASLNDFQQTNVVQGMLGDGTRGVTEGLKQRVVLPITGSYRDFNHVLIHELVHAFQFDLMFGRNSEASGHFNPPLWFMEGMAEYLSNGMDNITRLWVRDELENGKLLSIDELNRIDDIRAYRIGQSFWYYLGELYGKKKIGQILKTAVRTSHLELAFKRELGKNFQELTRVWHAAIKKQVTPVIEFDLRAPGDIAEKLTTQKSFFHRMNVTPAVSPDGNMVAYVSNENLHDEIHLLQKDPHGRYHSSVLLSGGQSKKFESLHVLDTSIGWSRDGSQLAFVSKSGRDDHLFVMNPFTRKILHEFNFKNMNGLLSPTFSPDGKRLAFVGMNGGRSDLYIVEFTSGELSRLTDDRYAVLHPQWSPDGAKIAYATDRGTDTNQEKLLFGHYDLAVYFFDSGEIQLLTDVPGDVINPYWSPDGVEIAFISDHQGIPNIYRLDLRSGTVRRVTSLRNGVAGITRSTPAFSWAAHTNVIVFSSFLDESWQLFRMELSDSTPFARNQEKSSAEHKEDGGLSEQQSEPGKNSAKEVRNSWLPRTPDPNELLAKFNLVQEDSIEAREYSSRLRLDGIFMGANIGGFLGSVGGAQFLFSDLLGNRNLVLSAGIRFTDILNSDIGVIYFNQRHRLNYGFSLFQQSYTYAAFASFNQFGFIEQTYRTLTAFAFYPFSRFARIELSTGFSSVGQRLIIDTFSFSRGRIRQKHNLGSLQFGQMGVSLVFDHTVYGLSGPIQGGRSRFSILKGIQDMDFTSVFIDYRRYWNLNVRSNLAWRFIFAGSYGKNAQFFGLGGPFTFRGSDYNQFIGPYALVQNFEFRFPLLPFLPFRFDFLSGVAFIDVAAAWGADLPGYGKRRFQPFTSRKGFHLNDLNAAFGLGARLRFGFLSLRFDLGWPTDLKTISSFQSFFSVGTDF